jgi:hypothetical protein
MTPLRALSRYEAWRRTDAPGPALKKWNGAWGSVRIGWQSISLWYCLHGDAVAWAQARPLRCTPGSMCRAMVLRDHGARGQQYLEQISARRRSLAALAERQQSERPASQSFSFGREPAQGVAGTKQWPSAEQVGEALARRLDAIEPSRLASYVSSAFSATPCSWRSAGSASASITG